MSDFSGVSYHKARKTHTCVECKSDIEPGERYAKWFFAYDGAACHDRACLFCDELSKAYSKASLLEDFVSWQNGEDLQPGQWDVGGLRLAVRDYCREVLGYDPDEKPPVHPNVERMNCPAFRRFVAEQKAERNGA